MKAKIVMGVSALFLSSAAIAQVTPAEYEVKWWDSAPTTTFYQTDPFMQTANSFDAPAPAPLLAASYVDQTGADQFAEADKAVDSMFHRASEDAWIEDEKAAVARATEGLPLASLEPKPDVQMAAVNSGFDQGAVQPAASYTEDAAFGVDTTEPAAPVAASPNRPQMTYRTCEGPSDDRCIQMHERGVPEAYASWQNGQAQMAMARADQQQQLAMNDAVADPMVQPASYTVDAAMADEPLDVSQDALAQADMTPAHETQEDVSMI